MNCSECPNNQDNINPNIQYVEGPEGKQGPKGDQGEQGVPGPANTLSIGTVSKGTTPQATIEGAAPNQILNLTLPQGAAGIQGLQGLQGPQGPQGPQGIKGDTGPAFTTSNLNTTQFELGSDGKLNLKEDFANALTETKTGKTLLFGEVSPILHKVDISGTANDTVKICGKNLLPYPYYYSNKTQNGITITDNGDGTLTLNGTTTARTYFYALFGTNNISLPAGTYTPKYIAISGTRTSAGAVAFEAIVDSAYKTGSFTIASAKTITARLDIDLNSAGITFDNYRVGLMLVADNVVPTSYEAYVAPTTITIGADGTAQADSMSPNMTLFSSGNDITATVNLDINTVYTKQETDTLLNGKSNIPENYALIQSYEVTEANKHEVSIAVSLSKVFLYVEIAADTTNKVLSGSFIANTSYTINSFYTTDGITTVKKYFFAGAETKNGILTDVWVCTPATTQGKDVKSNRLYTCNKDVFTNTNLKNAKITSIKVNAGDSNTGIYLPVGTKIYVYGVN